jgi:ubiquinone/menaquinone biosynthesis C-methylase UbiE
VTKPSTEEGWRGWDDYAPFYDWENARTLGLRDVPFWRQLARRAPGRLLELGCGTGRVSLPLARSRVGLVGIDRSAAMLARARARSRRARLGSRLRFVRGDIRVLPFAPASFGAVIAPYGILQSLLNDRDLTAALDSIARVVTRRGIFAMDLVPDLPTWREYRNRVQLRGRKDRHTHLTLIESVRQDSRRQLTWFEQRYIERRGRRSVEHRFELTFRTLSVRQLTGRLARAGFSVDAILGDYRGGTWDAQAEAWIILARRT